MTDHIGNLMAVSRSLDEDGYHHDAELVRLAAKYIEEMEEEEEEDE